MLYNFLAPAFSEEDKLRRMKLFQNLKVAKFGWFTKMHFGNWPAIHISFKVRKPAATLFHIGRITRLI